MQSQYQSILLRNTIILPFATRNQNTSYCQWDRTVDKSDSVISQSVALNYIRIRLSQRDQTQASYSKVKSDCLALPNPITLHPTVPWSVHSIPKSKQTPVDGRHLRAWSKWGLISWIAVEDMDFDRWGLVFATGRTAFTSLVDANATHVYTIAHPLLVKNGRNVLRYLSTMTIQSQTCRTGCIMARHTEIPWTEHIIQNTYQRWTDQLNNT